MLWCWKESQVDVVYYSDWMGWWRGRGRWSHCAPYKSSFPPKNDDGSVPGTRGNRGKNREGGGIKIKPKVPHPMVSLNPIVSPANSQPLRNLNAEHPKVPFLLSRVMADCILYQNRSAHAARWQRHGKEDSSTEILSEMFFITAAARHARRAFVGSSRGPCQNGQVRLRLNRLPQLLRRIHGILPFGTVQDIGLVDPSKRNTTKPHLEPARRNFPHRQRISNTSRIAPLNFKLHPARNLNPGRKYFFLGPDRDTAGPKSRYRTTTITRCTPTTTTR